jgi:DinB superfamily
VAHDDGRVPDYTALSLTDVGIGLANIARETQTTFGGFDGRQLNWRPDAVRWSVAQCFEHLFKANDLMFRAMERALSESPRGVLPRVPILPGVLGRMLIRSQAPGSTRKFTAAPVAQPEASNIAADIVHRFVEQHQDAVARLQAIDERKAAGAIMRSPIVSVIVYSVLDGWRLVVAHDWRHIEQARRVTRLPGFLV